MVVMNIPPSPSASSVAGTHLAATRGGELDKQTADAIRQQQVATQPGGKPADSVAVNAGDSTHDRDADGRQMYDHLELSQQKEQKDAPEQKSDVTSEKPKLPSTTDGHIDFHA
jgi:hypothetical protein